VLSPVVLVGIALCVGWVVLWVVLQQQVRRQSELDKKIAALEAADKQRSEK
jgi:hypothetical protein